MRKISVSSNFETSEAITLNMWQSPADVKKTNTLSLWWKTQHINFLWKS